jgi:single-stranded DNA-binding protein
MEAAFQPAGINFITPLSEAKYMNNCVFVGSFTHDPVLSQDNEGTYLTNFTLEVEDFRKDKSGSKRRFTDVLDFQAWHTGAEAMCSSCKKGTVISAECVARYDEFEEITYFRVKNFKVIK